MGVGGKESRSAASESEREKKSGCDGGGGSGAGVWKTAGKTKRSLEAGEFAEARAQAEADKLMRLLG